MELSGIQLVGVLISVSGSGFGFMSPEIKSSRWKVADELS